MGRFVFSCLSIAVRTIYQLVDVVTMGSFFTFHENSVGVVKTNTGLAKPFIRQLNRDGKFIGVGQLLEYSGFKSLL